MTRASKTRRKRAYKDAQLTLEQILAGMCRHCRMNIEKHVDGKCLFAETTFEHILREDGE